MARKKREKSPTGIYHVMLRGINKQEIFFREDDVMRMMQILRDVQVTADPITKRVISDQCTIYAYCILHNHLHLLFKEGALELSDAIKRIEDSYAVYYNKKYTRVGHLFQGRFASEAVKDELYFRTVLRYIALNPVKAREAERAEDYPYSSWGEYVDSKSVVLPVVKEAAKQSVLDRYPAKKLKRWVETTNDDKCLDMDDDEEGLSDAESVELMVDRTGVDHIEYFRQWDPQTQIYHLLKAVDETGMTLAQAGRVGSVTYAQLRYAQRNKKCGENYQSGSDPNGQKCGERNGLEMVRERVRGVHGMGNKTFGQLMRISEYLFMHPGEGCQEVADGVGLNREVVRRKLVLLANEGIVRIEGDGRSRTYSLT